MAVALTLPCFSRTSVRSPPSPSPVLPYFCNPYIPKEPPLPFTLEVAAGRRKQTSTVKLQKGKGWSNRRQGDSKDLEHSAMEQLKDNLTVKGFSSEKPQGMRVDQAVGQVMAAQANFMRVIVEKEGEGDGSAGSIHSRADDTEVETSTLSKEKMHNLNLSHRVYASMPAQLRKVFSASDDSFFCEHEGLRRQVDARPGSKVGRELLCVVRAVLKKIKRKVMVGDRVLVSGIDWIAARGMVEDVFERKSQISDPPVANVDHLLVLFAMDKPRLDPFALSRFLVEAESTSIRFSLVLNKMDLVSSEVIQEWDGRVAGWGYKPIFCSIEKQVGLDSLVPLLKGCTSVVVGPSGVGKSSLINFLRNEGSQHSKFEEKHTSFGENNSSDMEAQDHAVNVPCFEKLPVSEVSQRSGRGRHTTRQVSLFHLPIVEGVLADTPGFSHPGLTKVTSAYLGQLFPEVALKLANSDKGRCGFANCLHVAEPNCVVGGDWDRYPHYLSLLEEMKKKEEFEKKIHGTKRESDVRYKSGALGIKQAEPMLVCKTHRRLSRKQAKQTLETDLWE